MKKKKNILLVLADDQRFDTIAALGNPDIKTPHLDKLVARGTSFTHAYIPGGTNQAVCMPSRAMLNSGRTLFHIQREGQEIPPEHTTLGEAFGAAGYQTWATGKWHNGRQAFNRSFKSGDDIFFGGMYDHWNVPVYHYDPSGEYRPRLPLIRDWEESNQVEWRSGDHVHAGSHSTELFCDAAIEFIRNKSISEPFFATVNLMAPHDPRTMPQRWLDLYDPNKLTLAPNCLPVHPFDIGTSQIRDERLASTPRTEGDMRRHLADYYAMISHLDDGLGRLVSALENRGILDDTIIVFSADNGLAVGSHGLMGKQNLYEHSLRVPLILAGPDIPCGKVNPSLVYLFDIFPSLCELTGVSIPDSVEGRSFVPVLKGERTEHRDMLYLAYGESMRGIRTRTFKLIEYAVTGSGEKAETVRHTSLFNLEQDPYETRNMAGLSSSTYFLKELRHELKKLAIEWDDEHHPLGETFWHQAADITNY